MAETSKTLTTALDELQQKLAETDSATICNLSKQLAMSMPRNFETYLPYGNILTYSLEKQKNGLYSATYRLVSLV